VNAGWVLLQLNDHICHGRRHVQWTDSLKGVTSICISIDIPGSRRACSCTRLRTLKLLRAVSRCELFCVMSTKCATAGRPNFSVAVPHSQFGAQFKARRLIYSNRSSAQAVPLCTARPLVAWLMWAFSFCQNSSVKLILRDS